MPSEDAKRNAIEWTARKIVESSNGRINSEEARRKAVEIAQNVDKRGTKNPKKKD